MLIPILAIAAALSYLVASRAGWIEALSRRPPGRPSGDKPRRRLAGRNPAGPEDRLEVFEEFLRHLGKDDADSDP